MKAIITIILFTLVATTVKSQQLPAGPQVLTFFSAADDTEQPYGLYLPKNYDATKKYPLVIMLHGAGSNHRLALRRVFGKSNATGENDVEASRYFPAWEDVNYIVATPFARGTMGYQGIAEKDVYDVLADVKKRFSIDEDRTYLTGLSMGGGGTIWIGLTRPDLWAALAPVCPARTRDSDQYMINSLNTPMHFFHGDADKAVPVSVSRDWVRQLKEHGTTVEYDEYPGVEHNSWENAYKDGAIFRWFAAHKRNLFPDRVTFATSQYEYKKAYWISFDRIVPGTRSAIDAQFTGPNQLTITTTSLDAFTIRLSGHPKFKKESPVQITLNGKKIKAPGLDSLSFVLKDKKWINDKYVLNATEKKPGSEGPLRMAFARRHIYVYGTEGNPTPEELKKRIDDANTAANWSTYRGAFRGRIMFFPRIVADKDLRPSDYESCDMILFGTRETNKEIAKLADQLPMHLPADIKDKGLYYVYPVKDHYVAVVSGLPYWTGNTNAAAPASFEITSADKDYVLFSTSNKNIVAAGTFTNDWKITGGEQDVLRQNGVIIR